MEAGKLTRLATFPSVCYNKSQITHEEVGQMAKPDSHSALQREEYSAIYRFSALLDEPVRPAALQNAIDRVMPRFPSFAVRIRRGLQSGKNICRLHSVRLSWIWTLKLMNCKVRCYWET